MYEETTGAGYAGEKKNSCGQTPVSPKETAAGHLAALLTIFIWGTTFISTKVLLVDFQPVEILFFRFLLGSLALLIVCPRRMEHTSLKRELTFAAAGFCGVCLYYLLENVALTLTSASNVGVIISVSPFFTALLSRLFLKGEERLTAGFFTGFAAAMAGIALISLNGSALQLNPAGDLLALLAAFVWAIYSILTRKISGYGCSVILTTRQTFFYGLLFMLPVLLFSDSQGLAAANHLAEPARLLNLLFLGLGASALCFVTWNFSVRILGAVQTCVYIYMVPVITIAASVLILKEPVTWMSAAGTLLTLAGLFLSQRRKA